MAVAALLVSLAALGISGLSAFYTRRQARAETESTAIERRRHHAERSPALSADVEDVNGDQLNLLLRISNDSNESIDRLEVELPSRSPMTFPLGLTGVPPDSDGRHASSYDGPIRPGERAVWRVELDEDTPEEKVVARVRSFRGEEHWDHRVTVELPYDIGATIL